MSIQNACAIINHVPKPAPTAADVRVRELPSWALPSRSSNPAAQPLHQPHLNSWKKSQKTISGKTINGTTRGIVDPVSPSISRSTIPQPSEFRLLRRPSPASFHTKPHYRRGRSAGSARRTVISSRVIRSCSMPSSSIAFISQPVYKR